MSETKIKDALCSIFTGTDVLREQLNQYEFSLVRAGHKPLANQGISDLVKSALLVESIREKLKQ